MKVVRQLAAGATLSASLLAAMPLAAQTAPATASNAPKLIVFMAVDQMRPEYFERFLPQLTGGLGRLYRNGAVFTNAFQDHAITETAPGHSVMLSGRFPAHNGIVTNALGVPDDQAPLLTGRGAGASPYRFRGTALFDWLRFKDGRSRALSVSRKDRGAILPLGRAKQDVFWYGGEAGFTTSRYYADTLPTWVNAFNARKIPQTYAGKQWTLLLPESAYPEKDSMPAEAKNFLFPHPFPAEPARAAASFADFPVMDSLTAQMALAGVNALQLGKGPQTDLLAVSLSTTDAVGHAYGPDSREIHDQIVRLDRYVGEFIDSLYKIRDSSTIAFALTADHGVQPNPEVRAELEHVPDLRADVNAPMAAARQALQAKGVSPNALQNNEGAIYLDRAALAGKNVNADSVLKALATALRAVKGVAEVDDRATLAKADTTKNYFARRWLHQLPPDFQWDLALSLAPYYYTGNPGGGATHGSPNDLDAHVPVVFYGPWFVPGKYAQRALVADIAPTLAAISNVSSTEKLDGRARTEAIKRR